MHHLIAFYQVGSFWGEDMIVTSNALRDKRDASALTYVEITTLERDALESVLVSPPHHISKRLSATHWRACWPAHTSPNACPSAAGHLLIT